MKIGCIGQGFVGKNIADNYENRGFDVVRYSLESEYCGNKHAIKNCDIVFIAVPTPTTPEGFDASVVESVLGLIGAGSVAVIKSTVLPGTTARLQKQFSDIVLLFSPEFLCESTAAHDVANPIINIVGTPSNTIRYKKAADSVISTFPNSAHNFVVSAESAELFKYAHNLNGYFRVILANLLFDVSEEVAADWGEVKSLMDSDPMMSPYYNNPVHKGGRGAGGNCFIKDMAAFRSFYQDLIGDSKGVQVFSAMEAKNIELLNLTQKDQHLVNLVYGDNKKI